MRDDPILVLGNIILQQLMRDDEIFADQLLEVPDVIARELAIVRDDLKGELLHGHARLALTIAVEVVRQNVFVKGAEHFLDLPVQRFHRRRLSKLVEKDGVTFDLGYLETELVRTDKDLQQLLNDQAAVTDLGFGYKPGETADVGNESLPPARGNEMQMPHDGRGGHDLFRQLQIRG